MFENLTDRLEGVFKKLRGHGKLTEENIQEAMQEVRRALLEADVNFKVVKDFVAAVTEKAIGQEVLTSLSPGQQVIKIVHDELVELLGSQAAGLRLDGRQPVTIMLAGLQGSGKTTTAAKLAHRLKNQGRRPFLVPADVYRPAAIEQLHVLGAQIEVPVFASTPEDKPVDISRRALAEARAKQYDTVIIDTAGRLHVDEALMEELKAISRAVPLTEVLFVADAMTGQDAVTVAEKFNADLEITGVILTKMEGDARGGAALSVKKVTGRPIKFVGMGEEVDALEIFHPDRTASRILGMGDMLSLIEKAEAVVDEKQAQEAGRQDPEERLYPGGFSRPDPADQEDGQPGAADVDDPGHQQAQAAQGRAQARRAGADQDRGDYPVHDLQGAAELPDHQCQPPGPDRQGVREPRSTR